MLRGGWGLYFDSQPFDELMESWLPLTYMLNNLSRGLGTVARRAKPPP